MGKHVFHYSYISMAYRMIQHNILQYISVPLNYQPLLLVMVLFRFCIHFLQCLTRCMFLNQFLGKFSKLFRFVRSQFRYIFGSTDNQPVFKNMSLRNMFRSFIQIMVEWSLGQDLGEALALKKLECLPETTPSRCPEVLL
jgi:hypothetical protein